MSYEKIDFPCGEEIEKGEKFEICKLENYEYIRQNLFAKNKLDEFVVNVKAGQNYYDMEPLKI